MTSVDTPPVVMVAPRPYEIALACVPAGMVFRYSLRSGEPRELRASDWVIYAEVPGAALTTWGCDLTTRLSAHSIGLGRMKTGRPVWQRAARMLTGDRETPTVIYVLLKETKPYRRPVWLADSIREETTEENL
jgi:hypothetical protein